MSAVDTQQEIFNDYTALLASVLPTAAGFVFHDRKARLYREDETSNNFNPTKEYQIALLQTLKHGEQLGEHDRIAVGEHTAYLFRLTSDSGWILGCVTALVNDDLADKPRTWIENQISPALHSLQRELGLRYRLVRTHRKYEEKASDHAFLRKLGEYSRAGGACELALENILNCCAEHLSLEGISLVAPDRGVAVHSGKVVIEPAEAGMLVEDLNERYLETTKPEARQFRQSAGDTFNCPILEDKRYPIGILSLSCQADPGMLERLQEIAEPLAASIEFVIERDFDSLTGLPKWSVFETQLTDAYDNNDGRYTLMHFDIDRMQLANDTFGRELGDGILRDFGATLKRKFGGHPVTRISGNFFAALLHNVDTDGATELGNEICKELDEQNYSIDGKRFRASVSIGIAPLIPADEGVRAALGPAQVACEAAKDRGRGRVEVYQSADESIVKRLDDIQMIGTVKAAIEEERLELHAQPITHLNNPSVAPHYEILVRMLDENGGIVEPKTFMSAAERFQIMPDIDRWVVKNTIDMILQHEDKIHDDTHFAINLSGQSIADQSFAVFLKQKLSESGLRPSRLCFEITETAAVGNHRQAQAFMREFRAMGCQLSLDDFGTGLSSFMYLKMFPVTTLKIDGTFVADIDENEVSRSMVTAISEIARVLELETVAEFVSNKESVDILRSIGITWAQGHYVGKPRQLASYLEEQHHSITNFAEDIDPSTMTAKALPDDLMSDVALANMGLDKH